MTASPLVITESVSRSFDGVAALESFELRVDRGEIHAIVGLNGAGKTTLMRLLLGMLRPDKGSVRTLGQDAFNAASDVWARVGHLIETPFAYPELTVTENLHAAALLRRVEPTRIPSLVSETIQRYELGKWADRRARALSLGNRQRLGIGAALMHDPALLILDEPGNALDPAGVVFVRDLLRRSAETGAGVLVSSHHLDELARIADRITVLHAGRRVGDLDPRGANLEKRFFELVYEADLAWRGGEEQ